jgi:hypothetical protein
MLGYHGFRDAHLAPGISKTALVHHRNKSFHFRQAVHFDTPFTTSLEISK